MSQSNSFPLRRKKEEIYFLYFLLLLFVSFTVLGVSHVEDMDLTRYIENAEFASHQTWANIVKEKLSERGDFIYYLLTTTAVKLSIPLTLVTTLIVMTYYLLVIDGMKLMYKGKIDLCVIFCVLFAAPFVWVVSISRNLTAVMFLYIAIMFFYKKRWLWMALFLVLGVFTHFTVIMWVVLFVGCLFAQKVRVKTWQVFVLLILFFIGGRLMPMLLQQWMMLLFKGEDIRYSLYSFTEAVNVFSTAHQISIGDRLLPIYATVYSSILLLSNKKQGFEYWTLFVLTILLAYFLNSSMLFVNRTIMFMPLFWGMNVAVVQGQSESKRKLVRIISIIGIPFIMLYLYTTRYIYFF